LRRYDTGFKIAAQRFSGSVVALMAADMLLGDERRWRSLTPNGTKSFFEGECPRMLVLSRLELDDVNPCCNLNSMAGCHDAFVFRSPLHSSVNMGLFNFQQNVWQAENYAVGLLRHGSYELYNPCFDMPLFHNHVSNQRPNQNENRLALCTSAFRTLALHVVPMSLHAVFVYSHSASPLFPAAFSTIAKKARSFVRAAFRSSTFRRSARAHFIRVGIHACSRVKSK
jgi:hypothetical protein